MSVTFRPLSTWPGAPTPADQRRVAPFRSSYSSTLELLQHELDALRARRVVLELDLDERAIRLDGLPRAGARPETPGVVVSFESDFGPLRYACDRFLDWQDNVRAIALGLEALRKVERYGIARRGEQYAGWKALPAGDPGDPATSDEARDVLRAWLAEQDDTAIVSVRLDDRALRRSVLRRAHPDLGGDPAEFRRLARAAQMLTGERVG